MTDIIFLDYFKSADLDLSIPHTPLIISVNPEREGRGFTYASKSSTKAVLPSTPPLPIARAVLVLRLPF